LHQATRVESIARHAAGYGLHTVTVDGNDVEAVHLAAHTAVQRARRGEGPSLIEAQTLRMLGHAVHDGAEYVPRELLAEWEARDPVRRFRERLSSESTAADQLEAIDRRCGCCHRVRGGKSVAGSRDGGRRRLRAVKPALSSAPAAEGVAAHVLLGHDVTFRAMERSHFFNRAC
jgi:hypothetical protein